MFRKLTFHIALIAFALFSMTNPAFGQTTSFTYQGSLKSSGNPANGNYDFQFKLFDALASGGQVGSTVTKSGVIVTNGGFTVTLDFGQVFPGADRWLEVGAKLTSDPTFTVLTPRQQVTSAPQAIRALSSGTAGTATTATNFSGSLTGDVGGTQGATVIQPNAVTAGKIASNQVVKNINGVRDFVTLATGGILSTTTSGSTVNINAPSYGGDGSATSVSRSDHTHTGQSWGSTANGLVNLNLVCGGVGCNGALALTNATDANTVGLLGIVNIGTSQGVGVWGRTRSESSGSAAVYGDTFGSSTNQARAIWGDAGGNGIAIYGHALTGTAKAALFDGNVQVNGTLSKSAGSFKIDHPLDPTNKYLYHSFVESPDMMNIYNGNATTDNSGNATVVLPNWFQALNGEYRYQLTVIGQFAQAIVAEEIKDNHFTIKTDKPNVRVSWQVTGIRHDPYANSHRIPVEEDKAPAEKGTYTFPELFGQPAKNVVPRSPRSGSDQPVRGGQGNQ